MILSISSWDSLNDEGDHLSNFSEYFRTALSPWARISSMTPLTIVGTSALGLKSGVCSGLDLRYLNCSLEIILAKCCVDIENDRLCFSMDECWSECGWRKVLL